MRKILFFLLLMIAALPEVQATCSFYGGVTSEVSGYLNFGNVVIQRDAQVGSTIATAITVAYNNGDGIAGCKREAWSARWELTQWGTLSGYGNGVYNTNLPGVGLRLSFASTGRVLPYEISYPYSAGGTWLSIPGDGIKGELIKTGDITSGTLTDGVLARASVVNQFYFANVTLNGSNIVTAAACQVTSRDVYVDLGDHDKNEFSGAGDGTEWKTFNIDLQCDNSARINVQIDATQDASNIPGVMRLDSGGGDTTASGVGVELWYRYTNAPVQFGQVLSNYWTSGGGPEKVQLQAHYRQTADTVTAGQANATATFTLSYK
ncbi:TPA: fimbrial protein [Escherichia coli]|uniref:fimbrial protein n=1 Tax=Escherichia coli TaxID=562 RepID=UPI0010CC3593|nr:fimbrial protein [Escherichia coli]EKA0956305.1 fimbrial protein [Escherichia coli]MCV8035272.1 fimbrial protein [Escherichia coli]GDP31222.1 fimbrial protein [Escherichia coli]HAN8248187.1 fimbrial protein [Escherichia coli]HAN8255391.1 fimbrial protein [Escherichia coli]